MVDEKPSVDAKYLLEKFPGKGGWTYIAIPEIKQNRKIPFGWVRVKGSIDSFQLKQYKLMPMGNGKLFLPVKAAIRKQIKKEAGDYAHVILYSDESDVEIPEEIILCFENEPKKTFENFQKLGEGAQKAYLDWIYDAKTEDTKANRIIKMMDKVLKNKKLHDKED